MNLKLKSILRLALPYILIALLPIVSVVFLSGVIVRNHTNEIMQNQNSIIEVAADRVDEKIAAAEERAIMITNDSDIVRYALNGLLGKENDIIFCTQIKSFLSVVSKHPEIAEVYLYDSIEGRIISADTVMYDASQYFDFLYQYQDCTTEQILSQLQNEHWRYAYSPVRPVVISGRAEQVIEYKISIPVNRQKNNFQLVIALDVESLFQDYFDALSDGAEFHIYCSDELVFSSSDRYSGLADRELPGTLTLLDNTDEQLYAVERSFHDGSWRVRFYYPELAYANNGPALMAYLAPAVTIPVILCVLLCIYFTHINRRQIMELLSLLRGKRMDDNDLTGHEYISHKLLLSYAGDMAEKFKAYENHLREAHASEKNTVLERLVRNAYRTDSEIQRALHRLPLPFHDNPCAVICIQFDDAGTAYMITHDISARDVITNLLEIHVGAPMEVFDNLSNEVVCILSVDDTFEEVADNVVSLLNVHIKYRYGFDLHIGIGNPVDDLRNVHLSYGQAREVIRYNERTGSKLYMFSRMDAMDEVMLYPVLTDEKISNYMTLGKADEAKDVIMDIYKDYFSSNARILSLEAIDFIKYRITNTVLSVAERQGASVPSDAQKLLSEKNISKYFGELTALVDTIVEQISSRKDSAKNVLAVNVNDYIHEHFTDAVLTIKQIAAHFHFHENYVSNLYKEEYGENLSTAIEKLRIEKACELLGLTETKIGDVAEAVGYSSDSSFRRAFKKITGVSPVDYRHSH